MESVEERVKQILLKKDNDNKKLKEEIKLKELSCQKYEELLKRQREDLLRQMEK